LETLRSALRSSGSSDRVIDLVCQARRSGTEAVYGHKWAKWLAWCKDQGVQPTHPSSAELAEFLAWLSADQGLAASTVRGYRSAVSTTVRQLGGSGFSDDQLLRDLSRALLLKEARSPRRVPMWDLFLVLSVLRSAPFEPLSQAPLKLLTFKTVFLLALASSRRRSEVHALSGSASDIAFEPDGSATLRFLPEFLAKNQTPGFPSPVLRIRSLAGFLTEGDADSCLCPVRSLRLYLDRTRSRRSAPLRRLFLSLNEDYRKDVSAGTISRWISDTVVLAYKTSLAETPASSPRAHELRALASSAAFLQSCPLRQVLDAAFWRSENPFIHHYLRDLRRARADGSYGISFVAAGAVLPSCSSVTSV
jgi:hypothetical protein